MKAPKSNKICWYFSVLGKYFSIFKKKWKNHSFVGLILMWNHQKRNNIMIFSEICQLQIHNPFTYDNRKVCEFWVHFASRETCIPERVHNIPLEKGSRNTSRKKPMRKRQCSKPTFNMYVRRKHNEKIYEKNCMPKIYKKKIGEAKLSPRKIGVLKENHQKTTTFLSTVGCRTENCVQLPAMCFVLRFFAALFPTIVVHCFWQVVI